MQVDLKELKLERIVQTVLYLYSIGGGLVGMFKTTILLPDHTSCHVCSVLVRAFVKDDTLNCLAMEAKAP